MDGRILGRSRTSPSREANSQDCTARWHRYVAAEQEYVAVRRALLNTDLSVVRASLQGRGPAGARGFRAAVHLLDALPMTWIEANLDVLLRLSIEGGTEWFMIRPLLDRVEAGRLDAGLGALVADITTAQPPSAEDFGGLVGLLRELGRPDLLRAVLDRAEDVVTAAARGGAEAVLALDLLRTLDEGWLAMTLPAVVDKAVASADNLTGLAQTLEALGQQEARDRLRGAGA